MIAKLAGNSLVAFGVTVLLSSLVAAYFLDAFTLDVFAIDILALGSSVRDSSGRAAKWGIAASALYALLGVAVMLVAATGVGELRIGGRLLRPSETPFVIAYATACTSWSLLNCFLLRKFLGCRERR